LCVCAQMIFIWGCAYIRISHRHHGFETVHMYMLRLITTHTDL
jgi:hypothetical protein